jgi:hypothetical protein
VPTQLSSLKTKAFARFRSKCHMFSLIIWKTDPKDKHIHKNKHDHTNSYVEHDCDNGTWGRKERKRE